MQAVNVEFSFACARILKGEELTDAEVSDQMHLSEEYRKVIEQIIHLPGIRIEIVGTWIWTTGDTYPLRKELKATGLFFAPKKSAWYYRAEEYRTKGGTKTLDEIRDKYGSETVSQSWQRTSRAIQ